MSERFAVIMAGGRGERFWPQSRQQCPKHLLPIVGGKPMLTQAIERLEGLIPPERVIILTNASQREAVIAACPSVPEDQVVAEPVGRDTAPAVGLAKILVKQHAPNATFAMLPADHIIHDAQAFRSILATAFEAAETGDILATIGIAPTEPATGYGYIHKGAVQSTLHGRAIYQVQKFVEKPDLATAQTYLDSGDYYWNAGMFVWSVASIEKAFATHAPTLHAGLGKIEAELSAGKALSETLQAHFPTLEKISIDYAVVEKSNNIVTIESAFDWDDVGAWPAVANHYPHDAGDNVVIGSGALKDASGNIVVNEGGHLTALLGVKDLIVVQTQDATLICPKDRAQDVKKIVQQIGENPDWKNLI